MGKKHKKHHKMDKLDVESGGLKLVLKVGGSGGGESPAEMAGSAGKHKHKKKKKKHRHERSEKDSPVPASIMYTEFGDEDFGEPPAKKALFGEGSGMAPNLATLLRDSPDGTSALQECLMHIHGQIAKKDVNGFFAFPVTDSMAPGYSSIIPEAMDLSTMKTKIENSHYPSIATFRRDFKLMCNNCCVYNRPDTIYYRESKRILALGLKMLCKQATDRHMHQFEKLLALRKTPPFLSLSGGELGLDNDELLEASDTPPDVASSPGQPRKANPSVVYSGFGDDLSADEILAQATAAAAGAAQQLSLRKPHSRMGFLRRKADGSTTLNIINPDAADGSGPHEKEVNLGALVGKLPQGTLTVAGFREDKRNKATPAMYMSYGPFSTYGPSYDSTFATVSKEDSDRLLETYGSEEGVAYAESVQRFVAGTGDVNVQIVDSLLNVLTHGEHGRYLASLKEDEDKIEGEKLVARAGLEEEGGGASIAPLENTPSVDMSFLDALGESGGAVTSQLTQTGQLLTSLEVAQSARLSQLPHPTTGHPSGPPGPAEIDLARRVTQNLTQLTRQVTPGDVASRAGLHTAVGLGPAPILHHVTSTSQSDDDEPPVLAPRNPFAQANFRPGSGYSSGASLASDSPGVVDSTTA